MSIAAIALTSWPLAVVISIVILAVGVNVFRRRSFEEEQITKATDRAYARETRAEKNALTIIPSDEG